MLDYIEAPGGMTSANDGSLVVSVTLHVGQAEYDFGIVADLDLNSRDPQEFIWLLSCSRFESIGTPHMSHEKNPGCLGYTGGLYYPVI